MGTDIHCHLERRAAAGQPWERVADAAVVSDRNYNLFAIMADVRNGRGFAGVKTGDGFEPISSPRGLPEDCTSGVREDADGWGIDGHSHSWLTVADIMAYDWSQATTLTGVVDIPQLARWKLMGSPDSWSGSISGPGIGIVDQRLAVQSVEDALAVIRKDWWYALTLDRQGPRITTDEMFTREAFISDVAARCGHMRPHFQVSWKRAYHECAGELLSRVVPLAWRHGSPDNVRLVFWFDN